MTHTTLLNRTETKTPGLSRNDFAKLYELYFPLVHRICYRYTKNREDAYDLAQEVFIKVHGNYSTFTGNSQPSTWLYRVATNHCLDHLRWLKRQTEMLSNYTDSRKLHPPQKTDSDEKIKRLMSKLMENLDEANRQVVFLRFEVGLSHGEIAEICGVSRVAITKRLSKFHKKVSSFDPGFADSFESVSCLADLSCCAVTAPSCASEENLESE